MTHLTAIFQDKPAKLVPESHRSGSYWSKADGDGVVTAGDIMHAELQSNRHRQHTTAQLFTGPVPFLSPNQQHLSTEERNVLLGLG